MDWKNFINIKNSAKKITVQYIVLLSDNEEGSQDGLHALHTYCVKNRLTVNTTKSKVMYFSKKVIKSPSTIIIIISLFAHSETMIVSIEHSKTHSMYKYNNYIQQFL